MSHYTVLVIGDVARVLAPYDETVEVTPYEEDGEVTTYNPLSKWDWYKIGGRWPGRLNGLDQAKAGDVEWSTVEPTWAVATAEGWRERGRMGWWGLSDSTDESEDAFRLWFGRFVLTIPADELVTVVDCHI